MSIIYNFFDYQSNRMSTNTLDVENIVHFLPKDRCTIITNIKAHNFENCNEFVIIIENGKIVNKNIISDINKYLENNNSRSYIFKGLVSSGNNKYSFYWSSY